MANNKLVLVGGVPGSGKTFIGKQVTRQTGVFVDKDTVSRFFTEALLTALGADKDDRESATYLDAVRPLEYRTMLKHAIENLGLGHTVVCAAPFIAEFKNEDWLADVELEVDLADAELVKVWVTVDPSTARERIISRNATRDTWKLANWETYLAATPHVVPEGVANMHVLDNSGSPTTPITAQINALLEALQ